MLPMQFVVAVAVVFVMMDPQGIPQQKGTKEAEYNWRLPFGPGEGKGEAERDVMDVQMLELITLQCKSCCGI